MYRFSKTTEGGRNQFDLQSILRLTLSWMVLPSMRGLLALHESCPPKSSMVGTSLRTLRVELPSVELWKKIVKLINKIFQNHETWLNCKSVITVVLPIRPALPQTYQTCRNFIPLLLLNITQGFRGGKTSIRSIELHYALTHPKTTEHGRCWGTFACF